MASFTSGDYNIPPDVTLEHVVEGDDWSFGGPEDHFSNTATAVLLLPIPATDVFLLSRSGLTDSKADISASSSQSTHYAAFRIHVKFNQRSVFDQLMVARIRKPMDQIGVGLFTPHDQRLDGVAIESKVILPEFPSPIYPINVWTDIPGASQNVNNVQALKFEAVQLEGSEKIIEADSLNAVATQLKGVDSEMKGSYKTSRAILYKTTNRPINIRATLEHTGQDEPALLASTTNQRIDAELTLSSPGNTGGVFHISARTSGADMHVLFPTAPTGSSVNLNVHNDSGYTHVFLHPTFEGNIRLQTSGSLYPKIQEHSVVDPTGQGRQRKIDIERPSNNLLTGIVYWGTPQNLIGNVNIENSGADNILEL